MKRSFFIEKYNKTYLWKRKIPSKFLPLQRFYKTQYLWEVFSGPFLWRNVEQNFFMELTISRTLAHVVEVWLHTAKRKDSIAQFIIWKVHISELVLRQNCQSLMESRGLVSLVIQMHNPCSSIVTWDVSPLSQWLRSTIWRRLPTGFCKKTCTCLSSLLAR